MLFREKKTDTGAVGRLLKNGSQKFFSEENGRSILFLILAVFIVKFFDPLFSVCAGNLSAVFRIERVCYRLEIFIVKHHVT